MTEEKRMVDTYEVTHAIHVGDREILFAVGEGKTDCPYKYATATGITRWASTNSLILPEATSTWK